MNPGEKRVDVDGNSYVFDHREKDLIHVYRNQDTKTIAVKLEDWARWQVTVKAQQEGLAL